MKAFTLSIALLAFSAQSFAQVNKKVQLINLLDAQKNYKAAVMEAVMAANQIADDVRFDEVVAEVSSVLKEEREEVVTNTTKEKVGFNLFGFVSASGQRRYDATKILLTNPENVSGFSHEQAVAFRTLQKKLKAFVMKNEQKIIEAKMFAARALQLINKLSVEEIPQVYTSLVKATQRVSAISFEGSQNITHCIRIHHERSSRIVKAKFGVLFAWVSGEESIKNRSYTEQSCDSKAFSASELADSSYDIMLADESISYEMDKLSLKLLKEKEAPFYPTWGSPVITN